MFGYMVHQLIINSVSVGAEGRQGGEVFGYMVHLFIINTVSVGPEGRQGGGRSVWLHGSPVNNKYCKCGS